MRMYKDSIQAYNKRIIDLACSVGSVKYQTSLFCIDLAPSCWVHIKKPRCDISQYTPHAQSITHCYFNCSIQTDLSTPFCEYYIYIDSAN